MDIYVRRLGGSPAKILKKDSLGNYLTDRGLISRHETDMYYVCSKDNIELFEKYDAIMDRIKALRETMHNCFEEKDSLIKSTPLIKLSKHGQEENA